jgi:ABC-type bacteriocin/lantibiotic exporter with double-glycine peptidase domain
VRDRSIGSRLISGLMKRQLKRLLVVCVLALPVCCATAGPKPDEETVIVAGVPFFGQEAYRCGPTALAIVLDYWYRKAGLDTWLTPEQIAADIYSPTARGVLGIDLESYGRRQGFEAHQYSGSVNDLRQNIDAGAPVIILVDHGFSLYEVNHFMVVTGHTKDGVIVNSGRYENKRISDKELEKIWKRTDYWTLVLKPSPSQ